MKLTRAPDREEASQMSGHRAQMAFVPQGENLGMSMNCFYRIRCICTHTWDLRCYGNTRSARGDCVGLPVGDVRLHLGSHPQRWGLLGSP